MTSVGGSQYWCHQCNRTVRPSTDDIICPDCNGGFVEEVDSSSVAAATVATGGGADGPPTHLPDTYPFPGGLQGDVDSLDNPRGGGEGPGGVPAGFRRYQPGQRGQRPFPGGQPAFLQVLEAMSAVLQQMQGPQAGQEGGEGEAGGDAAEEEEEEEEGGGGDIFLLQGQMQNFFGGGGNVEVFFDNGTGIPRRLPGNFGDYFLGPGLDQLIQQLAENDPNRYGAPPASKSAVEAMPTIQISHEHLGTDAAQCAVCKDEFEIGAQVRQMPCKHMYHEDCILPWLAQHNSCPVCRYEMPTDDTDYNQARSSQQSNSSAVPTAAPNSGNTQPGADAGPATPGGFTFWGSPASHGMTGVPHGGAERSSAGSGVTTQGASIPGPAPSGGGGGGGRRFSIQLPWPFRSSAPPPAPAPSGQAESSASGAHGASSGGGGGPNRGSEGARQEDLD
ncbi:hypothetical protein CY35_07G101700 [Sphagnum magellanicum]|uniref:Uncharacterized protein n=1 Tax=Sphagnum magellanicum TaxID=128215 RepID=A0ACB8HND8_9BRYO|nr:hypothetical protein CY35_07G101700 [Sphagnum magellanicum]